MLPCPSAVETKPKGNSPERLLRQFLTVGMQAGYSVKSLAIIYPGRKESWLDNTSLSAWSDIGLI